MGLSQVRYQEILNRTSYPAGFFGYNMARRISIALRKNRASIQSVGVLKKEEEKEENKGSDVKRNVNFVVN